MQAKLLTMKNIILIFYLLGTVATSTLGQNPYPHLTTMQLYNDCSDKPDILVHYDKMLGEEINIQLSELSKDHPLYTPKDEIGNYDILVLKLKFNNVLKNEYFLVYSSEPSCDPGFSIYDLEQKDYICNTSGLEIYIPGGSAVYTTGHINSAFNIRRKYVYDGTKFNELKPEFYYVGLESKTLKPITLFADELLTTKLAQLPANYDIEVLAAKRTNGYVNETKYLVKTALGLLGWCKIEAGHFRSIDVKGIMFLGD